MDTGAVARAASSGVALVEVMLVDTLIFLQVVWLSYVKRQPRQCLRPYE
jgi:hypothetical protein